ncbi:M20 family metallo-hydrolase [Domibacillus sp. A3M-37]|uniref:M20 family metallo-hydrolase n=1 Tax=Domibacillus sp. A3M-37 TaxID=2962037 RepID=UPI0020B63F31|nr:M20 family metallo-hydrolase [Domibacillus sp. A3M-37]MCP3761349.1 M20 family metallo-hydrolase [Domibacillus sp. A3M-37]
MKQLFRINNQRISNRIEELACIGKTKNGGVTRKALTKEDDQALKLVSEWMNEAGLQVRMDHFGNLIGRKEGKNPSAPAVMIGSHIDTVPNGGKFDGTIGVLGGIEVAQIIKEENIWMEHPLEVVAFSDEEGARFQGGLFGSRGMAGKVREDEMYQKDEDGISRFEALMAFGLNPMLHDQSIRERGEIKVYLEMHIEQGPYLQTINKPVGIVTGIAGPAWLSIKVMGESGHAGTVPMPLRKDAMAGAADIISRIEQICAQDSQSATVGTVGKMMVTPGGANVIPECVEFTLDIRDIDLERRNQRISEVEQMVGKVCRERQLTFKIKQHLLQAPVNCAAHVIKMMESIEASLAIDAPKMISGAGHDAMSMNEITDIGMIFVRCRDGISHNPNEWADVEDISKGTSLLLETALHYLSFPIKKEVF